MMRTNTQAARGSRWRRRGFATASALAVVVGVAAPATASSADAASGAADVVVDADWLTEHLGDPDLVVLEVSTEPGVYERGHIDGAVNIVWHTDLVDTVRRDLAGQAALQELLRAAGVDEGSTVVLYGDRNNWFAAWGAWVLNLYGVENVRLLDGGRALWEAESRELVVAPPAPEEGDVVLDAADPALRALLPDVLAVVEGDADVALVDIRSPDEFSGAIIAPEGFPELAVRAGHIPGAINVPWAGAVNEDGTFKTEDELRALYADAGIDGSTPIITYCRIGERASHTWFVLSKILGYDVAVYDGSWTEWGNAVGVPIENPAGTVWGGS